MGIFAKFAAALVSIPSAVLGGMTTFLFCAVAVSGLAIINRVPFNRRTRFILTAALALGYGATLIPTWFSRVFTYAGDNHALQGFLDAIVLVMETGFAVTALYVCLPILILNYLLIGNRMAMLLNATIGEEIEPDVRRLEGKSTHRDEDIDSISVAGSSKGAGVVADEKAVNKSTAIDV